ncbi:GNAT family N-acetyltransferase [Gorillibacterium timonense]|uniref:GNAT family N-acetyltransferase n=1 Tax=Gorillibacterium timonense TaxID=1689269 RepID=UPI00071C3C2B|nr:GNAT family N-acetyltransferase [Gorillibacterium timonense]
MAHNPYIILERYPTVEEHRALWEAVGWGPIDPEMAEASLASSVYAIVVACDHKIVGMGRIVGDGAMYHYIQDVAVLPTHQKQGVGGLITRHLIDYIKNRRHPGGIAFAGLFAAQGSESFYEGFGFQNHAPGMTGMFTVYREE